MRPLAMLPLGAVILTALDARWNRTGESLEPGPLPDALPSSPLDRVRAVRIAVLNNRPL